MEVRKELKYPIKYAVMPVKEQTGWTPGLNELEREYSTVANIVTKCYVISEKKEYFSDGSSKVKYEVVFPYIQKYASYNDFEPATPEYNIYSQCINSVYVSELFNSFEEALVIANQANEEILSYEVGTLAWGKNIYKELQSIKENHQTTINKYKKVEEAIEQATADMNVNVDLNAQINAEELKFIRTKH